VMPLDARTTAAPTSSSPSCVESEVSIFINCWSFDTLNFATPADILA
jgi:hypothetical protein